MAGVSDLVKTAKRQPRRKMAKQLDTALRRRTFNAGNGTSTTKAKQLSSMLVDLATNGETTYLNGKTLVPEDYREWLDTVKFIHTHLDGNANTETQQNNLNVNVFKVYAGIDTELV